MEIVLLWLDDLDDFVFAGLLSWEKLRRRCLQVGLIAALALGFCALAAMALEWIPLLAAVATGCVVMALLGAVAESLAEAAAGLRRRA